jgi:hypothetical protein
MTGTEPPCTRKRNPIIPALVRHPIGTSASLQQGEKEVEKLKLKTKEKD